MGNIFLELTTVICLAAVLAFIFRQLRQPVILAYILTGIIVGPLGIITLGNNDVIKALGQLGITLLLFIMGMELRFSELRSVGKVAIVTGVLQVIYTIFLGFLFSRLLGFAPIVGIYIGIALALSSTIVVVKMLSDKKDLNSLYGKMCVGILLTQDLIAIFILMMLSGFTKGSDTSFSLFPFLIVIIKGAVLIGTVAFLSRTVFPKLIDFIAKSHEVLFLTSLAFAFGMAAVVSAPFIGFSVEIGGLLAGLALANANASAQIVARVRALRDFFITIFFVFLGTQMVFFNIQTLLPTIIILTAIVLLYKPLIIMSMLGIFGYKKRTSFFTAVTLAEVSEFSLILVFLGSKLGQIPSEVVSVITIVTVISYIVSNYFISKTNSLYSFVQPFIEMFERKDANKENNHDLVPLKDHIVLIGAHRVGENILDSLEGLKEQVLVIDFNPDVIKRVKERENFLSLFGDISDLDIHEKASLLDAKLVISTVPDIEDNLFLLNVLKNRRTKVIVLALNTQDAKSLYKAGADYVVLPHLLGGKHIAKLLNGHGLKNLEVFRERDLRLIV